MSNSPTWLTLGLAGLGAAAAAASRGSANAMAPLEIDYSRALITGELWTSDWMVEQTSSQWYDLGPGDEDEHGEPLLRSPWPDKAHPYHLLAYDVREGPGRMAASMDRLASHLDHTYREVLLPSLGLAGQPQQRGFVRSHWLDASPGEVKLSVVIGLSSQAELFRIVQHLHNEDTETSSRVVLELGAHGEVAFHELDLRPLGVNGPAYPLANVQLRRGLGGQRHVWIERD